ncbi:Bacteriocin BCN5 [Clostridium perfringens]|uniref:SH3 domain-containing protein n=1 Tax=Clostridium perfringens TaxID=1502 RepID=UPI00244229FF|nr:SH3 domain-containing protein [Clostridium perfringens]EJT5935166.1 SH3 domain-containing protein [Clostridium perfringens]ELC8420386.1 SH3 domain-containing protein [Clostridium perfringens]ELC8440979.1 SH3 domain-containing protein [Clostridium perfringens]MDG6890983.1 Bacteriocin BCN5 [Clostridium perfringens]HEO1701373.1 SH3 domain-containing protein [Clostridium perfringens]
MVTGWKLVDGKWYYLESNGVMAIGWKELGGIWYYLNESGAMVKGWQTISGKTYYFNDSGYMLVGKQVIDGRNYNFNTSGQLDSTNWVKSNNKWYYYENGKMITGWKLINGEWYYLEGSGVMATGWKELGGIWYYLNESGAMVKGWQTISGKTYYFNDSGHMLLGKQTIDGKSYEFNGSGQLISDTGDISLSESTYIAEGEVINVQSFLNVRKGPGTDYDSIGQLYQGEIVNIVAKNEKWYKIKYGSGNGYVNFDYIAIIYNKKISLENWQEDCIKRGWGPITKEAYIEKINAVKLNKYLKDDIDDLVKKNLLRDTFDFLNPSKSDAISFANSLINDSTVKKFNDNRKGIFYFKETYESSARKEMSKFRAYKRLDNGQILRTIDLDIPIDKSKLSVRVKNSVKDVWKIKFLKGIDKVLVPLGFSIAVGTDFSVFLSEDELKSNDEIAAILAAVVVTNGLEVLLCSTIGAIATQIIGPEFPIVGAVVGGLAGAFAGYIIGKNLNNIEMERYLKNLILKILSLLE